MERRTTVGLASTIAVVTLLTGQRAFRPADTQFASPRTEQQTPAGLDIFVRPELQRARLGATLLHEYFQQDTVRAGRPKPRIDAMIAFLPDPLDSHLDYEFDAELAALRQAYEASGYTIDRFWLPCTLDREKTELAARNNRIDTIAYRHHFPGVILFRDITNTKLRVLYVLGEVPTSGMNATAFERALADRKAILADRRVQSTSLALLIVGPAFTGGASALADALVRRKSARRPGRPERLNITNRGGNRPVQHPPQPSP